MFDSLKKPAGPSTRRYGLAATLAVATVVMSPAVSAGEASPGLRVVKDPVSGQLRAPTAEESAVLERAGEGKGLRRAPRGLITGKLNPAPVKHADGTVEQELDESSLSYTVMTRHPDGSTSMVCVTGNEAADAALKGKKTVTQVSKPSKEHTHDHK